MFEEWITLMNSIHSGSQPCVIIKLQVCSPKVKHVVAKTKFNLKNIRHLKLQIIIFMLYALTYKLLFNHFSENWYNNTTYTMTTNIEATIFVILPRYGLLCCGNLTTCHNVFIIYKHVVMVHVAGSSTCFCFVWIACIAHFWFCASLTLPLSVLYPMFSYFMSAFSCYDFTCWLFCCWPGPRVEWSADVQWTTISLRASYSMTYYFLLACQLINSHLYNANVLWLGLSHCNDLNMIQQTKKNLFFFIYHLTDY